jgi:hypothetical protein
MSEENVIKKLQTFLREIISEISVFEVTDDNKIVSKASKTPVTIQSGKTEYQLMIFSENIDANKNILIVNPTAESLNKGSADKVWFYDALVSGLVYRLLKYFRDIIAFANDDADVSDLTPAGIELIAKYKEKMTKKFPDDFSTIADNKREFINVFTNRKNHAIVRSILFEDTIEKIKISKASKELIKMMMIDLFDVENDLSELTTEPESLKCPQLDATMRLYTKIYQAMNTKFELISPDITVDTIRLQQFIDLIDTFHDKTRWLAQSVQSSKSSAGVESSKPVAAGVPLQSTAPVPVGVNMQPFGVMMTPTPMYQPPMPVGFQPTPMFNMVAPVSPTAGFRTPTMSDVNAADFALSQANVIGYQMQQYAPVGVLGVPVYR